MDAVGEKLRSVIKCALCKFFKFSSRNEIHIFMIKTYRYSSIFTNNIVSLSDDFLSL